MHAVFLPVLCRREALSVKQFAQQSIICQDAHHPEWRRFYAPDIASQTGRGVKRYADQLI
jgi:hypothetical protein